MKIAPVIVNSPPLLGVSAAAGLGAAGFASAAGAAGAAAGEHAATTRATAPIIDRALVDIAFLIEDLPLNSCGLGTRQNAANPYGISEKHTSRLMWTLLMETYDERHYKYYASVSQSPISYCTQVFSSEMQAN